MALAVGKVAVVKGWKEGVGGNALSCACNFENGMSTDFEKEGNVWSGRDDIFFRSLRRGNGGHYGGYDDRHLVDGWGKQSSVKADEVSVVLNAGRKGEDT